MEPLSRKINITGQTAASDSRDNKDESSAAKIETFNSFIRTLSQNTTSIKPGIAEAVNDHFWELF